MSTEVAQQKGKGSAIRTAYTIHWGGSADYAGSIRLEVRLGTQPLTDRTDWAHAFLKDSDDAGDFIVTLHQEWQARYNYDPKLNVQSMSINTDDYTLGLYIATGYELWVVSVKDGENKESPAKVSVDPDNRTYVLGLSVYVVPTLASKR